MVAMKLSHQNTPQGIVQEGETGTSVLANHSTGLHRYKIKRKSNSKSDDDQGKTVKNNCANIKDVQCDSIRTGEILSICVVNVNDQHENSDKEIVMFAK